jgi:hypothetical protein
VLVWLKTNFDMNRKNGFVTYPFSVMRRVAPSDVGAISNVHVPPNGSFGSAMRVTNFRGGIIWQSLDALQSFPPTGHRVHIGDRLPDGFRRLAITADARRHVISRQQPADHRDKNNQADQNEKHPENNFHRASLHVDPGPNTSQS